MDFGSSLVFEFLLNKKSEFSRFFQSSIRDSLLFKTVFYYRAYGRWKLHSFSILKNLIISFPTSLPPGYKIPGKFETLEKQHSRNLASAIILHTWKHVALWTSFCRNVFPRIGACFIINAEYLVNLQKFMPYLPLFTLNLCYLHFFVLKWLRIIVVVQNKNELVF